MGSWKFVEEPVLGFLWLAINVPPITAAELVLTGARQATGYACFDSGKQDKKEPVKLAPQIMICVARFFVWQILSNYVYDWII